MLTDARTLTGCYCPDDCACHSPYRATVCGCTGSHGERVFDATRSPLSERMAAGHFMRTGHALTGYYVPDGAGIDTLYRTCACAGERVS